MSSYGSLRMGQTIIPDVSTSLPLVTSVIFMPIHIFKLPSSYGLRNLHTGRHRFGSSTLSRGPFNRKVGKMQGSTGVRACDGSGRERKSEDMAHGGQPGSNNVENPFAAEQNLMQVPDFSSSRRRDFLAFGGASLSVLGFAGISINLPTAMAESPDLAEEDVRAVIRNIMTKGKAAGVLRLVFHDAGTYDMLTNTGGMNGSIIYELDRPESAGLKKPLKVLQKARLEIGDESRVSWADLLAMGGAEAVALCGGPRIQVGFGRLDQSGPDPEDRMPSESLSASALKDSFHAKGFTTQELVVLSGAHTLGSKGFGSPVVFDNAYFAALLRRPWDSAPPGSEMAAMIGIPSDRVLAYDSECLEWIRLYASDQQTFFADFSKAYTKMMNCGAKFGPTSSA